MAFALQHDQQHYLRHNVLAITDRASMQHGIEVRVPYLDRNLQKIMQSLPARFIFGRERKWILKEILKQYEGEAYLRRPKTGFGLPFGEWLRESASEKIWQPALQDPHSLYAWLPREVVEKTLQAHLRGRADYTHSLWAWLSLFYWMKQHAE
ncbi:MAG: hypothetical protein HC913_18675 [Microscillaceae bacterium]|nr:hypothetical protein [Microscillaceae bacterium]